MVFEKFPELSALDAEQKLILAGELWKSATTPESNSPELSREAVELLEERLTQFEGNPHDGIKWEDLRDAEKAV